MSERPRGRGGRSNSDAPKRVVAFAGRAGTDPDWREAGDNDVLEFRLAVTKSYDEGAEALWFDVTVWNEGLQKSVEDEVYKGAAVAVEGTYSEREYDGNIYRKINATRVGLVEYLSREGKAPSSRSSRKDEDDAPSKKSSSRSSSRSTSRSKDDDDFDDLPF